MFEIDMDLRFGAPVKDKGQVLNVFTETLAKHNPGLDNRLAGTFREADFVIDEHTKQTEIYG